RIVIHVIRVLNDENACGSFKGPKVSFTLQFANRPDPNDLLVRTNHSDVSMFAPNQAILVIFIFSKRRKCRSGNTFTGRTLVTRFDALPIATVERFRNFQRECLLADSFISGKEK